jgi:soluble cytochrome b562
MSMISQLRKPLILFLLGLLIANPLAAGELKPTMKEMRLHYKQAMDATTAEQFNQKVKLFLTELQIAREFDFSSDKAKLSMEGLNKVHDKVIALPTATEANLAAVKEEFDQVDELRKEYHKKVKPSVFDLLVKTFKNLF